MLARARAGLSELLAPSRCPGCDRSRRGGEPLLCEACAAELEPLREQGGAAAALRYSGAAERLIARFKFERRSDALAVLLGPLALRLAELPPGGLVPVPRHAQRIREQGCDPVHTLARALARRSGRPLWDGVLHRSRAVPPQTGLGPDERRRNVAGSFGAQRDALRGCRAIALDDVTTTGATLREAARVLEQVAGAASVTRLALAATPPPSARSGRLPPIAEGGGAAL